MSASVSGAVGGLYDVGEDLGARLPDCPPEQTWVHRRDEYRLVNPASRRRLTVIMVGTELAGTGAVVILGCLGYRVRCPSLCDASRRVRLVTAQGGINAARVRRVDDDSLTRPVKDTVESGDYRGQEADVVRLGLESGRAVDHMEAIGAPLAREYGDQLITRSFGGAQVLRTYYTHGQTGQQLETACAQAFQGQAAAGSVHMHTYTEMLDLIAANSRTQGIVTRGLLPDEVQTYTTHAAMLAIGGYGSVYHYSTLAMASNATATWRAHRCGAAFTSACMVQFHPTASPVSSHWQSKTILMSGSLYNDGCIWVPMCPGDEQSPNEIPEDERNYYLERKYPAFDNPTPHDVTSRNAYERVESGRGVGSLRDSVCLDFRDVLERLDKEIAASRYGNPFGMYLDATGEDPYEVPTRIAPGAHSTIGGLWVDFDQVSTTPGLFAGGEASNNCHGANCLGANSLLSASVDGWFVPPLAVPNYLAGLVGSKSLSPDAPRALRALADTRERIEALVAVGGIHHPAWFRHRLDEALYAGCGVSRSETGLLHALEEMHALREEFWVDVTVVGGQVRLNQGLEKALRVVDFLELAEVMVLDAPDWYEPVGAHFREEYATQGGEAQCNNEAWCSVSAWQTGDGDGHTRRTEPLSFSPVPMQVRDY